MIRGFEWFIGYRYIKGKKSQAFISFITLLSTAGVMVGVSALIVVIAVMAGADYQLRQKLIDAQPHILIMNYGGQPVDYTGVSEQVAGMEGVINASPFLFLKGMLRSATSISAVMIKGIEVDADTANRQSQYTVMDQIDHVLADSPVDGSPPGIVLGKVLAEELGVSKDQTVFIITSQRGPMAFHQLPKMKPLRIISIIDTGLYEINKTFAWMRLEHAQQLMEMKGQVTGIEVRIANPMNASEMGNTIEKQLGFPFWTRDWMKMNFNLFASLKLQKTVMFIILSLIVIVAGFSIASTLIMLVMEKTSDIAILKAMGASGSSIAKTFIFTGTFIGVIGTCLGVGLGYGICEVLRRYPFIHLKEDIYLFATLPVQLNWLDVAWIASASMGICLVATLFPAIGASRLRPVDSIRQRN